MTTGPQYWGGTPDDLKMTPPEPPKNYIDLSYDPIENLLTVKVAGPENPELAEGTTDLLVQQASQRLPEIVAEIIKHGEAKVLKVSGQMPSAVVSTITAAVVGITVGLLVQEPKLGGYLVTASRGSGFKIGTVIRDSKPE